MSQIKVENLLKSVFKKVNKLFVVQKYKESVGDVLISQSQTCYFDTQKKKSQLIHFLHHVLSAFFISSKPLRHSKWLTILVFLFFSNVGLFCVEITLWTYGQFIIILIHTKVMAWLLPQPSPTLESRWVKIGSVILTLQLIIILPW